MANRELRFRYVDGGGRCAEIIMAKPPKRVKLPAPFEAIEVDCDLLRGGQIRMRSGPSEDPGIVLRTAAFLSPVPVK